MELLETVSKRCWSNLGDFEVPQANLDSILPIDTVPRVKTAKKKKKILATPPSDRSDSESEEEIVIKSTKRVKSKRRNVLSTPSDDEEAAVEFCAGKLLSEEEVPQWIEVDDGDGCCDLDDIIFDSTKGRKISLYEVIEDEEETRSIDAENHDAEISTPMKSLAISGTKSLTRKRGKEDFNALIAETYAKLNRTVFGGKLPADLEITWNGRLRTTAGLTVFTTKKEPKIRGFNVSVQLSSKVLDSEERVLSTLAHELCHVAAWIFDGTKQPPHGIAFKKWGAEMARLGGVEVGVCHNYEITFKFNYRCTICTASYGRHSKSIDVERYRCGRCGGKLELPPAVCRDGVTPKKERTPTKYNLFVQEQTRLLREQDGSSSSKDFLSRVASMWRARSDKIEI